jgi:cytochrome c-type biogenesis protein CcmH
MSVFWGLAGIMVIAALLFVVPAIMRTARMSHTDQDALNTAVIKSQLADLETDLQAGRLDRDQYEAARKDLERELLDDLAGSGGGMVARAPRGGQWAVLVLVVAIPLLATALYNTLGSKEIIPLLARAPSTPPSTPGARTEGERQHSIEQMIEQLAERLRQQPDDVQGWRLLAKSYFVQKRYPDAVAAYRNAERLAPDDPALLADYADALTMSTGGRFTDEAGALLERALAIQPDNVKALWLIGHWKNQQAAYTEALEYWQQAAALLPPGGEDATVLTRQIGQVQQRLGITPAATAQPPAPAATAMAVADQPAAGGGAITVTVALDPSLSEATSPDDTVFIFARALQGPRMPLAIVRKQVRDLPLRVTLDDSQAMSPAMVLSKFDQVQVGARISKSGNAMPQSGDLQGMVSPVATRDGATIELTIDSKVP